MGNFFKNNDFKTDYRKHPNDNYKDLINQLDEDTKKRLDKRRTFIMVGVVALVFVFVIVLAVTGIGTNKTRTAAALFSGGAEVKVSFLWDGDVSDLTQSLEETLETKSQTAVTVAQVAGTGKAAANTSYKDLDGNSDIVLIRCILENILQGQDPEGILEANIDGIAQQGSLICLVNYPYTDGAKEKAAVMEANGCIATASKSKSVLLMDARSKFQNLLQNGYQEADLFEADGVHLTAEGRKQLGIFIAEGLLAEAGLN